MNRNPIRSFFLAALTIVGLIALNVAAPPGLPSFAAVAISAIVLLAVAALTVRPWPMRTRLFRWMRTLRSARSRRTNAIGRWLPQSGLALMACLVLLAIAIGTAPQARAQLTPTSPYSATNLPTIVTAGVVSNFVSMIPITQGKGLAIQWRFNAASGTAVASTYFAPSTDGVTVSTNTIWVLSQAAGSTVTNNVTTNWPSTTLVGYTHLCIFGQTNTGGGGTITNGSLKAFTPNS